ncbi:sulfate adenylyltransferase [Bacterioplanes sanyensis]|uniref:Sulfate adenylyltransferase n=1 Tax=Bacterioplanes sanyensis TaxID=1249553 RepID=A0A222FKA4_9GAMM|nr:transglutaminase-like cysteine peptidase [Bacterioplanes sanyensis]ASP38944.1 sulfate adenylyltransferase [Bacterioplanes sanyensis]
MTSLTGLNRRFAWGSWLVLLLALLLWCVTVLLADVSRWVPDGAIELAREQYDEPAALRLQQWRQQLQLLATAEEQQQLKGVNQFFNDHIPFVSDQQHWRQEDFWATPFESLATHGGDCEDYVIAKYYSLVKLGVPTDKLRITYVQALKLNQAHMVLAYFPTPDSVPWVLDNLTDVILPASKRPDLAPVYSFNAEGMWLDKMKGRGVLMGNPNKLDRWTDLRVRMNQQGMDL